MSDIYCMEIDGITGSENVGTLSNQILIDSFNFGVNRSLGSSYGHGKNREFSVPNISNINITKSFDSVSTKIHNEALFGMGNKIQLRILKSADGTTAQTATTITLSNAVLASYEIEAHLGTGLKEHISISFDQYTIEHTPIGSDGKKQGGSSMIGYDITKVKKI